MLIDLAVLFDPGVKLTLTDSKPGDKVQERDVGLLAPGLNKIDYGVSCIMGNPAAF